HQLLYELDALELHQLRVLLLSAVERHLNLPGACKHLRILDRHLVVQDVRALACESLDYVEGFAVEVAGSVEPGLIVETNGVHDQRIPVPAAGRLSHPCIHGGWLRLPHFDDAAGARIPIRHEERGVGGLLYLTRTRR